VRQFNPHADLPRLDPQEHHLRRDESLQLRHEEEVLQPHLVGRELGPEGNRDFFTGESDEGPRRAAGLHGIHHEEPLHPIQVVEEVQPQGPAVHDGDIVREAIALLEELDGPDPDTVVGHDEVADAEDQGVGGRCRHEILSCIG